MSRLLWLSLILMLIVPRPILAQEQPQAGCDHNTPSDIASSAHPDYKSACEHYLDCQKNGVAERLCQIYASMILTFSCPDALCSTEALLDASAISTFGSTYMADDFSDASQVVWEAVAKGLSAFHAKHYWSALAAYQSIPSNVHLEPLIFLSKGLIYEALGADADALTQYTLAVQFWYNDPLIYYVLGNLNVRRGHTQEAAVDFSLMSDYIGNDSVASVLVQPMTSAYRLDAIAFSDWLAYPVLLSSDGPVGSSYTDETQQPSRAVKLAWIDDQSVGVAQNLTDELFAQLDQNLPDTLILRPSGDGRYHFTIQYSDYYGTWSRLVELNRLDSPITVYESATEFEGSGSSTFLLAPAGDPDPRASITASRCPGAALSRLKIGDMASGANWNDFVTLYNQPSGTNSVAKVDGFVRFTVLDGPRCMNQQAWWQVKTDDSQIGWVNESDGSKYLVYPADDSPIPAS